MARTAPAINTEVTQPGLDHCAILAAAGSGKTYQLAMRYLSLLHLGAAPRSILATTFTRLAAGEIRDRVVLRLLQMLDDAEARDALRMGQGDAISRNEIAQLLRSLVQQMDGLQIRTLDSFFASIVGAFSLELRLPLVSRMVDDAEEIAPLRREAIARLLNEREPQRFVDLFRRFTQGQIGRSVTESIEQIVSQLHTRYRETERAAWQCVPEMPTLSDEAVQNAIDAMAQLELSHGNWRRARDGNIQAALQRDWKAVLGKGLTKAVHSGAEVFYKKPISDEVRAPALALANHAMGELINRAREQTLATWELLHLYDHHLSHLKQSRGVMTFSDLTFALLNRPEDGSLEEIWYRLDGRVDHLLLDEFQDTSTPQWQVLQPLAEEIVAHRPPQRSFFCVGDVKQSIYGWRDTDSGLLLHMHELLPLVRMDTISQTRRSAQPIVDAVNDVFANLATTRIADEQPDAVDEWLQGFAAHSTIHADLPGYMEMRAVDSGGDQDEDASALRLNMAAEIVQSIHEQDPRLHIGVLVRSNATVSELLARLGPRGAQLPVSGYGGSALTDAAPVNVILDVLQLADHPTDTAAAFHVLTTPARSIIALYLADQPISPSTASESSDAADHWENQSLLALCGRDGAAWRARLSRRIRKALLERGYGAVIGHWVALLLPDADQQQARRLMQLVELAHTYDPRGVHPLADFISLVEQRRVADTQPAAIEIMTIHQSKGLGFDVVVLPELEGDLVGRSQPPVVFERAGLGGPIARICRYINEEVRSGVPELAPLFDNEKARRIRDSLSLLYVGMTRAKQGLYMQVSRPKPTKSGELTPRNTMAGILWQTLGLMNSNAGVPVDADDESGEQCAIIYARGDQNWISTRMMVASETPGEDVQSTEAAAIAVDAQDADADDDADADARSRTDLAADHSQQIAFAPDEVERPRALAATPASRIAHEARPLAQRLSSIDESAADESFGDRGALEHGRAIHALFEQIEWLEQFEAEANDDARLLNVVLRAVPRQDRGWAMQRIAQFRRMLQQSQVRTTLMRSNRPAAAHIVVYQELPAARLIEGCTQWSILDRVELHYDSPQHDRPRTVRIIDYKTDAVDPDAVPRSAEQYRAQMQTYRTAIVELFLIDPRAVTTELLFVAADVLLPIPPL